MQNFFSYACFFFYLFVIHIMKLLNYAEFQIYSEHKSIYSLIFKSIEFFSRGKYSIEDAAVFNKYQIVAFKLFI